eukprot:g16488.t1
MPGFRKKNVTTTTTTVTLVGHEEDAADAAAAQAAGDIYQMGNIKLKSKARASKGGAAESTPPSSAGDAASAAEGNKKKKSAAKRLSWGKRKNVEAGRAGKNGGAPEAPVDVHDTLMDAGETDGTQDIPAEYRDADGNFKRMPVPRQLGSLTRRRPPLVAVVGMAGCGKSRLASALVNRGNQREYRTVFGVGQKTVTPKVVIGEELSVLDCPGLPDPLPRVSDTYYNDTVLKLRSVGYANAVLFVVCQARVTPTLIKNYGLLYRAFNRLDCLKIFAIRIETSFVLLNRADQEVIERRARKTVNQILAATNLKEWDNQQFFMLTAGSGEEQDKQVKYIKEQVKKSPKVDITAEGGLRLTTEVKTEEVSSDGGSSSGDDGGGSKRNSRKFDMSVKGEKSAEKSGCCVM